MKETYSKVLLIVEALVFLAPVTLLSLWLAAALVASAGEPQGAAPLFALVAIAAIGCCWWAVGVFVIRGRAGIAKLGIGCVIALYAGAALAIAGGVAFAFAGIGDSSLYSTLALDVFGLPVLVPFVHLEIERRMAR